MLESAGYCVVAVSPDTSEVLASFSARHGIKFPLLSDAGGRVIERLGLLNVHVEEQHAAYGISPKPHHEGVPYPGVFVIRGSTVVDKRFHQSYRERETGSGLLERALGIAAPHGGPRVDLGSGPVNVTVRADSPTYGHFQRIWLIYDIELSDDVHIYASPVPEGCQPLVVRIDPIPGVEIGATEWPPASPIVMSDGDGSYVGYQRMVRGYQPLTFSGEPGGGDVTIQGTVMFQACTMIECWPPADVAFRLRLAERPLVERPIVGNRTQEHQQADRRND